MVQIFAQLCFTQINRPLTKKSPSPPHPDSPSTFLCQCCPLDAYSHNVVELKMNWTTLDWDAARAITICWSIVFSKSQSNQRQAGQNKSKSQTNNGQIRVDDKLILNKKLWTGVNNVEATLLWRNTPRVRRGELCHLLWTHCVSLTDLYLAPLVDVWWDILDLTLWF